MSRTAKPYGLWVSTITASIIARGVSLKDVRWAAPGAGGAPRLVWLEGRAGHGVLVAAEGHDAPFDVTSDLNVKAKLGYGGGEFATADGDVFFVAGGRIYRQPLTGGGPRPITPPFGQAAAPTPSPDGRFVAFVHSVEQQDCVAVVDAEGRQWPQKIVQGDDFYMQPAWHPNGDLLAVVAWNHPQMPWDGTELRLVRLRRNDGQDLPPTAAETTLVVGGPTESVLQPEFSPDGRYLAYVSDRSGFWHLYLYDLQTGRHTQLTDGPYEHGEPAWVQGIRTYAFAPDGRSIFYTRGEEGYYSLWQCTLSEQDGGIVPRHRRVEGLFDQYGHLAQIAVAAMPDDPAEAVVACIASAPHIPPRIVAGRVKLADEADTSGAQAPTAAPAAVVVRRSQAENFEPGSLATPRPVRWYSPDGSTVHGLYYAPTNPRFAADGPPPAVINVHGGPTSQSVAEFNPRTQWFATRGYAVLEVNYRGSTGYGRAYRDQLKGRWGIVDVEDAVSGANFLVREGLAQRERLVIIGGSAGGYTVLRALITHPGFFRAGLCLYGVTDLFALASDTHKLEERYTDSLVGPLPEAAGLYRELSPLFHAQRIQDPVAIFQGTDDPVVTKPQADALVAALEKSGAPYEYHVYEGEGHGWSRPETIEKFYAAVDAFLRKYVVFAW